MTEITSSGANSSCRATKMVITTTKCFFPENYHVGIFHLYGTLHGRYFDKYNNSELPE